MEFDKEVFEKTIEKQRIVRYKIHFEQFVKSYLKLAEVKSKL